MKKIILMLTLVCFAGCSMNSKNENSHRPSVPHDLDLSARERSFLLKPNLASADDALKIARYYLFLQGDEIAAILWFERSKALGNQEASKFLDEIRSYDQR